MGHGCSVCNKSDQIGAYCKSNRIHILLDAARRGDAALLQTILTSGASVDECDRTGRTALHLSCAEGRREIVQHLLSLCCNIHVRDKCGREPLHEAVEHGHAQIVSMLERAGAVLSSATRAYNEDKMRRYAHDGNMKGMDSLIRGGISPLSPDYLGKSALQVAADNGQHALLEYVVKMGFKLSLEDKISEDLNQQVSNHCHLGHASSTNSHLELDSQLSQVSKGWRNQTLRESGFTIMQSCPEPIAHAVLQGRDVEPLHRPNASLFFSDIVGFTTISSTLTPVQVSSMLNALFKRLDRLAHLHGVQKIDVIGDAYIAATNFTEDQPHDHAARLARFALDAVAAAGSIPIDEDAATSGCLQIRVGMHCGPVTGIAAGRGAHKYTLLGEAARVAARMESSGAAGMVQCSEASARLIEEQADELMLRPREGGVAPAEGEAAGRAASFWVSWKRQGWRQYRSCKELPARAEIPRKGSAGRAAAAAARSSASQLDGSSLFWAPAGGVSGVGALPPPGQACAGGGRVKPRRLGRRRSAE